jgi:hypothetical protein
MIEVCRITCYYRPSGNDICARSSTGQSAGLRTRRPKEDNHLQSQHLSNVTKDDLARFLAFLSQKDPDLARLVEHWPDLPEYIKAAVKALIQANSK